MNATTVGTVRTARAPVAAGADPAWRPLYRTGGAAALLATLTYIIATVLDFTVPAAPSRRRGSHARVHRRAPGGLHPGAGPWLAPGGLLVVTVLALAVALKGVSPTAAAAGGLLGVASWALTLVYPASGGGAPRWST